MQTLKQIFSSIIDVLFPQACTGCSRSGALLCQECLASIPRANPSAQIFISAVFDYQNPLIRKSIWRFKYKNARGFAKHFGAQLYEEVVGNLGDGLHVSKNKKFLIIPIPLHRKRLRERGYNQSELIVRAIIKQDAAYLFEFSPHALVRIRETKPQARSDKRAARLENLRGAFRADASAVRGKDIVLVDDVTTTGATLSEARKALRAAGARSVSAYAVAH